MTDPVRLGVIGCGDVMTAYMAHAQLLCGQGRAEVTWACDQREARGEFMRQHYAVSHFTTDYRELLASNQVDLVLVLTSMAAHGSLASAALQAGKHVLVEKPLAVTLEEAARLVEQSRQNPGRLFCAPFVMLSPTYQIIGSRIRRGDIGPVLTARARYGHAGPTWGPWYYQTGGAIFDLAPYNLTSLTGLLGPAKRVTAMTGTAIRERVIDEQMVAVAAEDNAQVVLDFGESVLAVVTTGFTMQQYRNPALELYGARGTLQMMGDDWDPEGYELFLNDVGAWQIHKETHPAWLWTDGLRHAIDCIQHGAAPLITPEQAYHVLEIMLKAKACGRDGQTRTIDSTFPLPQFETAPEDSRQVHLVHDRTHEREGPAGRS